MTMLCVIRCSLPTFHNNLCYQVDFARGKSENKKIIYYPRTLTGSTLRSECLCSACYSVIVIYR